MKIKFVFFAMLIAILLAGCARPSEPSESDNHLKIEKTLSTGGYARDLFIEDEILFVAEDEQGFSIYNHISGTRLCLMDSVNNRHFEEVLSLAVAPDENLLFVYDTYGTNTIFIYDISDLTNPENIYFLSTDTASLRQLLSAPNPLGGIDIFWSNNNELKFNTYNGNWLGVDSHYFPNTIERFDVNDEYIAVAGLQLGFYLAERASGDIISTTQTKGQALDVKIVDNNVIVAIREEGFIIFDITDPANPQEVFSKDVGDLIYTVDAEEDYLLLSSHAGGVFLYDIADIADPQYIGKLGSGSIGFTYNAILHNGKIFAATRLGIQIISF